MLQKQFSLEEELKAKEITMLENKRAREKGLTERFSTPNAYIGKLGEWAFADLCPRFIDKTKDFIVDKYDFIDPSTFEKIEVKATGSKVPFDEHNSSYLFAMDASQFNHNKFDIMVRAHYWYQERIMTLIGYNYRHAFLKSMREFNEGEPVKAENGRELFIARNHLYAWQVDLLYPIEDL